MQKLFILAALAACCLAAPTIVKDDVHLQQTPLQRPSPINPEVKGDPKPSEDKITVITDPKEIAKHKREIETKAPATVTHLLPTVRPAHHADTKKTESHAQEHHHQKREQKNHSEPATKAATPAPLKKPVSPPAPVIPQASQAPKKPREHKPTPAPAPAPPKESTQAAAPVKHRQKRDDATTDNAKPQILHAHLLNQEQSSGHFEKPQTLPAILPAGDDNAALHSPQLLPVAALEAGVHATGSFKRDIPVPLVPKHQHPEESSKEEQKKEDHKPETHTEEIKDIVQVEDLSEKVPAHQPQQHHQLVQHQEHHAQHEFHPQHPHAEHKSDEVSQPNVAGAASSTTASTEHPIIRPKPVPVSELFSRPKQSSEN